MAGLVPAIDAVPPPLAALLIQRRVQVQPAGVGIDDQLGFPGARPVLHVRLALNGGGDGFVGLHIDEALETVALGEALRGARKRVGRCRRSRRCRECRSGDWS